jgi:3-dehydroquinate dehydratase type I
MASSVTEAHHFLDKYDTNPSVWFELWLDLIQDIIADSAVDSAVDRLTPLLDRINNRSIVLFRRPGLAKIHSSRKKRNELITLLSQSNTLLDLDLFSQADDLLAVRSVAPSQNLILSYHNYNETPSDKVLLDIVDALVAENPAMIKIACYCASADDALRLLTLLRTIILKKGYPTTVLGMGPHGVITRIAGSIWGNEFLFAPPSGAVSSAPGQLTFEESVWALDLIKTAMTRG